MRNILAIVVLVSLTSQSSARVGLVTPLEKGLIDLLLNCDEVKNVRHHTDIDPTKLRLHWYNTRTHKPKFFTLKQASAVFLQEYDSKHNDPIYLYIHGFNAEPTDPAWIFLRNGMLKLKNINYLLLDVSHYLKTSNVAVSENYLKAVSNVYGIGYVLGDILAKFIKDGLPLEKLHVIGHSLGAHLAGYAAQRVHHLDGTKLKRIAGIDPALACFDEMEIEDQISSDDAEYVDIYHSNKGVSGTSHSLGTANFFINDGGPLQPSCIGLPIIGQECSHLYNAVNFWVESALKPQKFVAQQCDSYENFELGKCENRPKAKAGLFSEPCEGNYYIAFRFNYVGQMIDIWLGRVNKYWSELLKLFN